MPNVTKFGQVASTLAGALVVLAACNTAAVVTQPGPKPVTPGTTKADDVKLEAGQTSSLQFTLRIEDEPKLRQILALPSETTAVDISLSGSPLGTKTITATVKRSDFKDGVASITLEQLPVGVLTVGVTVRGDQGRELGKGSADAKVVAGKINPVRVVVKVAPATGGLAIEVDAIEDAGAAPTPAALQNKRIDRLAIPSLVLVFYGYNGFSRPLLGDPAVPKLTAAPPEIKPLTLVAQVKDGTIKDPTRKALQAGFDGMDKYNAQNPSEDRAITAPYYAAVLSSPLVFGRDAATAKGLSEALTPDMQTLDMGKATAFLTSGRALADDVVDTELKALSGANAATDKISKNDKAFKTDFPYLAEPF